MNKEHKQYLVKLFPENSPNSRIYIVPSIKQTKKDTQYQADIIAIRFVIRANVFNLIVRSPVQRGLRCPRPVARLY